MEALGLDEVWWLVSPGNPLKSKAGMAPLNARFASAQQQARRARIVPTVIERDLGQGKGTRYTSHTLKALTQRYPAKQFVWLMGSDNLAQFHLWRDWRGIARRMPIAVIARPGYDAEAMSSPAMAWLRKFHIPAANLTRDNLSKSPALVTLRFDPDPRSATALRRDNPDWAEQYASARLRDPLTHHLIESPGPV